ncbi:hypothetical protein B0T24DRAFT_198247 [Lasiosphaeria ovina]|uniref:Uncharacterized protein n=1 Tax=Lasiosphaeria ovina TaxID=92902 RepID=A0AAE0NFJ9_9PEZI|nr:hypothetical protein B0T24DRAFT_198247 [Lasiosphaeria ovina]
MGEAAGGPCAAASGYLVSVTAWRVIWGIFLREAEHVISPALAHGDNLFYQFRKTVPLSRNRSRSLTCCVRNFLTAAFSCYTTDPSMPYTLQPRFSSIVCWVLVRKAALYTAVPRVHPNQVLGYQDKRSAASTSRYIHMITLPLLLNRLRTELPDMLYAHCLTN